MVSAEEAKVIQQTLTGNSVSTNVMIDDAGKLVKQQKAEKRGKKPTIGTYSFEEYLDWDELEEWMSETATTYTDHTELINLATTAEGRTLWGIHMGDKDHTGSKKKVFMGEFLLDSRL